MKQILDDGLREKYVIGRVPHPLNYVLRDNRIRWAVPHLIMRGHLDQDLGYSRSGCNVGVS
jgi:hypothetical protein